MGDMIRCGTCGTFHYRNDPCPVEYLWGDREETEINGIDYWLEETPWKNKTRKGDGMKIYFTITENDVGSEAYRNEYVETMQKELKRLRTLIAQLAIDSGAWWEVYEMRGDAVDMEYIRKHQQSQEPSK